MINPTTRHPNLWGLVLAGGEGKRMEAYVRELRGECLPKQYVNFIGTRSMLQHTFDRIERLIPRQQILTIVSAPHLSLAEVRRQLSERPAGTVIVQPENKDTGPGILLPLAHLHRQCPEAIVIILPSDHFILEEDRFLDHVNLAACAVHHDPSQIVLLAMEAQRPEPEYGYVVAAPGDNAPSERGCRRAALFVEKPNPTEASLLVAAGALWNTMIMVCRVETLLGHIQELHPELAKLFFTLSAVIGTTAEESKVREIYRLLRPLNFSKDILERIAARSPAAISILPVLQVTWSDWGSPQRLAETKSALERCPGIANAPQADTIGKEEELGWPENRPAT